MDNLRSMTSNAMNHFLPSSHFKEGGTTTRVTYHVTVTTGCMKFAGTDSNVYIAMTGASGDRTSLTKLDNAFHNDFERGSVDKFKVKMEDIGKPVILTIKHEETGMFSDWYAASVSVQKTGEREVYRFPVNMWVSGMVQVAIGDAKLPQNEENPVLISFRKHELAKKQRHIQWRSQDSARALGLPGGIMANSFEELPRNLQLDEGMTKDFEDSKKLGKYNIFDRFQEVVDKWDNFAEVRNFFAHSKVQKLPEFQQNWERDEEFGRQMMNGCHPAVLKRCDQLPKNFPVTNRMVSSQMTRGHTLEQEIKNGNVYVIDLNILEGLSCGKNPFNHNAYFSCSPACLLYLNSKKNLVPIAIQLWQQPGVNNLVWTPDDSDCDWLLAKMYFRNAEANVQMIVEKIFHCHFVLEPFVVGLLRCLSQNHPVHKLLLPHLRYVCAANLAIRTSLLNPGGALDKLLSYGGGAQNQIIRSALKSFRYEHLNVRKVFTGNGTLNKNKLPGYHFRDDSLVLWDSLQKFVGKILGIYYKSDEDVKVDEEIQSYIKEIRNKGFWLNDNDDKGFPETMSSISNLVEFVTCIVFTASCRQAAVSNALFDIYVNVPNAPFSMSFPPPSGKGKTSHDTMMQCLPSKQLSCLQVSVCHALSRHHQDQVYLADYPGSLFCEDAAQHAIVNFRDEMTGISSSIRGRNERSMIPYDFLLPEKIPLASSL
ncbi:unnamed protein product [Clavelina lepadiformis]|uniref:Uncharacterized protein n=1 Tax=Clavelina lepadiformis TaxID=159417 RepID=A0ABP0GUA4_CLALP